MSTGLVFLAGMGCGIAVILAVIVAVSVSEYHRYKNVPEWRDDT